MKIKSRHLMLITGIGVLVSTGAQASTIATIGEQTSAMLFNYNVIAAQGVYQTLGTNATKSNICNDTLVGGVYTGAASLGCIPINFNYNTGLNGIIGTLPVPIQGTQLAHMVFTIKTNTTATTLGPFELQTFDLTGTFAIIRDTPYFDPISSTYLTNLLSGTFTASALGDGLSGNRTTSSNGVVNFNSSTDQGETITFNSDFLIFPPEVSAALTQTLTSVGPCYKRGSGTNCPTADQGTKLHPFTGVGSGTFAYTPPPRWIHYTPEPATWTLGGIGAILMGLSVLRRKAVKA